MTALALMGQPGGQLDQIKPIPVGSKSVSYRIPYRLSESKHIIVRAKVNGAGPFNFIMDTGAPTLFLSKDAAQKAGIQPDNTGWATFKRMEIEGGAVLEKSHALIQEPAQLTGMNSMGLGGLHLDGVMGFTLLSQFRMELDLNKTSMIWTQVAEEPRLRSFSELSGRAPPPSSDAAIGDIAKMLTMIKKQPRETTIRGFFGIELTDAKTGVHIKTVLAKSPAESAGLKAADEVTQITVTGKEPQKIANNMESITLLNGVAPGESVLFTIIREGKKYSLSVCAGKWGL